MFLFCLLLRFSAFLFCLFSCFNQLAFTPDFIVPFQQTHSRGHARGDSHVAGAAPRRPAHLDFSDKKPLAIELLSGVDFREATKGIVTACYFNEADKLGLSGRYVRISFSKEAKLQLTEIEVFTPETAAAELVDAAGIIGEEAAKRGVNDLMGIAHGTGRGFQVSRLFTVEELQGKK